MNTVHVSYSNSFVVFELFITYRLGTCVPLKVREWTEVDGKLTRDASDAEHWSALAYLKAFDGIRMDGDEVTDKMKII